MEARYQLSRYSSKSGLGNRIDQGNNLSETFAHGEMSDGGGSA